MNKFPVLAACALVLIASAAVFAQSKTSMDYLMEGSQFYMNRDYKRAIPLYQRALDLEKQDRKLERKFWLVLIDSLAMAYGTTGGTFSSPPAGAGVAPASGDGAVGAAVLEYGISKEPTYPMFHYNMACGYGELGDEDNAIKSLRSAYKYKANMIPGERLPDPMTDSSFAKFADSQKFTKAVAEMKSGK